MYILTIPSFTWIKVPLPPNNQPPARAGHTCTLHDGQIIILGGYTGNTPSCESPGIHIFNATALTFQPNFRALPHAADDHPENSVLAASFGYRVPDLVASIIGGTDQGGATASTPAAGPATDGPFATGKPPVFTVTSPGATATATVTTWWPTGSPTSPSYGGDGNNKGGNETGLIVAGLLAGLAGVAAGYLGYCAWLYRRQVRAYKSHLAVANRYSPALSGASMSGGLAAAAAVAGVAGRKGSVGVVSEKGRETENNRRGKGRMVVPALNRLSTSTVDSLSLGWAVPPTESRFLLDEDRPSSGSGTGSGSGVGGGSGSGTIPVTGTARPLHRGGSVSGASTPSRERLLAGQEPSFFSVVLGPRRALRVVNGLEGDRESVGE
jgi:hypothetical protein